MVRCSIQRVIRLPNATSIIPFIYTPPPPPHKLKNQVELRVTGRPGNPIRVLSNGIIVKDVALEYVKQDQKKEALFSSVTLVVLFS
jgi:hypothetical protein